MNKKWLLVSIGVVIIATAVFFIFLKFENDSVIKQDSSVLDVGPLHPLTGLPVDKFETIYTVAIMIDNGIEVPATFGVQEAPIVFEAPVEGGRTRMMLIIGSDQQLDKIGPVRSIRPYFLNWAAAFHPMLMHVGGSPEALARVDTYDLENIDQIGANEIYFYRDDAREAPHNVFTDSTLWRKAAERKEVEPRPITLWKVATPEVLTELEKQQITVTFSPDNIVDWVYNTEKNNYLRFWNRERYLTPLGEQVSTSNVVIIDVNIQDIDAVGRLDLETLGSGDALIFMNGQRKEATWVKQSSNTQLIFLDRDTQSELALSPGQTWVTAVPDIEKVNFVVQQ